MSEPAADAAAGQDLEACPDWAGDVFGAQLGLAMQYAASLAGDATVRGLLGPREASRMWTRHVLSCAEVAALVGRDSTVADIGSGAGLPGIPMALAAPQLRLTLVESLARRVRYLHDIVDELGLGDRVAVHHGRAEELRETRFGAVTSRAVAPLPTLLRWSRPLVQPGGVILAVRGGSVGEELAALTRKDRVGLRTVDVVELGVDRYDEPVRVLRAEVA